MEQYCVYLDSAEGRAKDIQLSMSRQLAGVCVVSEDDFLRYVRFRMLDNIGIPGVYKRFMHSRKEQHVEWAVTMCSSVGSVQNAIKDLAASNADLRKSAMLSTVCPIWQYVMDLSIPPTDLPTVIGQCQITGREEIPCTLLKCKGRGAQQYTISKKFTSFFNKLWIVFKMDTLIKIHMNMLMQDLSFSEIESLQETAVLLDTKSEEMRCLARGFFLAYMHVFRSTQHALCAIV